MRLTRQGTFAEIASLWKVSDYGFLAAHGYEGEIYLAALNVEDCIRGVALRKDVFTGQVFAPGFSGSEPVKEIQDVKLGCQTLRNVNPVRNDRQVMMRNRRQRESATQWNPGRRTRHCGETSSHGRYLSVLQSLCKGMT